MRPTQIYIKTPTEHCTPWLDDGLVLGLIPPEMFNEILENTWYVSSFYREESILRN